MAWAPHNAVRSLSVELLKKILDDHLLGSYGEKMGEGERELDSDLQL